jgi:hypothetical protein
MARGSWGSHCAGEWANYKDLQRRQRGQRDGQINMKTLCSMATTFAIFVGSAPLNNGPTGKLQLVALDDRKVQRRVRVKGSEDMGIPGVKASSVSNTETPSPFRRSLLLT